MGRPKKSDTEKVTVLKRPNWNVIVYPESAPENWQETLKDLQISFVCSPLHNKDVWTAEDEKKNPEHIKDTPKKAHYHLILCYSSNKTIDQVKADIEFLNCPRPEVCRDFTMSVRYLIHYDNKEKFHYLKSDIVTFGNVDIEKCFKQSFDEIFELKIELVNYCDDNEIYFYYDLVKDCMTNNKDWAKAISVGEVKSFIKDYLYSKMLKMRYKKQDDREDRRDRKNGILPPAPMTKEEKKELESLADIALDTASKSVNIVARRNKK